MGFWSNFVLIILYWEAFLWNHPPFWEMRISWTVFHHNLKDFNSFLLLSLLINVNLHFNQVSSCWWRLGYADCSFFYSCSILFQIFFLFVIRLWGMLWSLLLLLLFFFSQDGQPPLGWSDTVAYLVLPAMLVVLQYMSVQIMQSSQVHYYPSLDLLMSA